MSNRIDVEFSSNLVETASLLSSVVKFCQEAGMKWIDSSKECKPTSAHILIDDKVLEAKFPLLGVKGDAGDYEIATGLTNRAMTVHLNMSSKECHFVGARKTQKLGRDALEALARTYVGMLKCDRLEIGDDQAHLLTFLKFPAYYVKESGEILGVTGELPSGKRGPKHVLEHIFKKLVLWKKFNTANGIAEPMGMNM